MAEERRDATNWILQLIDKVTAPAQKAGKAVASLTKKLQLSERAAAAATRAHARLADIWRRSTVYTMQKAQLALGKLNEQLTKLRNNERLAAAASRAAAYAREKALRVTTAVSAARAAAPGYIAAMRSAAAARFSAMPSRLRMAGMAAAGYGASRWGSVRGWWQRQSPQWQAAGAKVSDWVASKWARTRGVTGVAGERIKKSASLLSAGGVHKFEGAVIGLGALHSVATGRAFHGLAASLSDIAAKFQTVLSLAKVAAVAVTGAAVYISKKTVDYAIFADSAKRTLSNLAGGPEAGELAWNKAIELSRELGLDVHQTADSFKELLAAQFKLGEAEELVKLSADLKDVTGDAAAAQRALLAMTQIKAKGRLQGQELTQQLANAGLSTKLVYDAIAERRGVSTNEAIKLVSSGKIDADTGLAAIGTAIKRKLHEHEAGEAARGYVTHTITGLMDRLHAAPGLLFTRIAEEGKDALEGIKPILRDILDMFDRVDVKAVAHVVVTMFEMFRGAMAVGKGFVEGFLVGFPKIAKEFAGVNLAKFVEFGRQLGRLVAQLVVWLIRASGVVRNIFLFVLDNRWIIYLWLGAKALGVLWGFSKGLFLTLYAFQGLKWLVGALAALGGPGGGVFGSLRGAVGVIKTIVTWLAKLPIIGTVFKEVIEHTLYMLSRTAITFSIILGLLTAIVWLWWNWDDVVSAGNNNLSELTDTLQKLGNLVKRIMNMFADGDLFTAAGYRAGKAFVAGFFEALRAIINFINPFYYYYKVTGGPGRIYDKNTGKLMSMEEVDKQGTGNLADVLMKQHAASRAANPVSDGGSGETRWSSDGMNRFANVLENIAARRSMGDVHITVHANGDGEDDEAQNAADKVGEAVRAAMEQVSTQLGGNAARRKAFGL